MRLPLESDYLVPNATFFVWLVVVLVGGAVLVVWPAVESWARRQWVWTLAVVLLAPIGGLVWLSYGRRVQAR